MTTRRERMERRAERRAEWAEKAKAKAATRWEDLANRIYRKIPKAWRW